MNRSRNTSICGRLFSFKSLNLKYLAILILAMVCLPFLAYGQNATILGTVTDPSGAVVPNVTISITHVETGRVISLASNDAGQFVVPDIPIGHYNVKASVTGFKVTERLGVLLNQGDRIRVDFQLALGTTAQSVSVEANPIAVQTDTGQVDSLVNGTQIAELASNGRTIYSYVSLTPGASQLNPDSQLPVPTGGAAGNISFNGNRNAHNLYLLDGGENSDRGGAGTSSILPSLDAIAETQTMTSNYSADYGLSSGGTISSVVKSGSKTLHASAWEFFRNDALDARNYFNPPPNSIGELRYNIYGFNIGGPVSFGKVYNPNKSKTFFFYNMEWRKFVYGNGVINRVVPPTGAYGGDFTGNVPADSKLADKTTVVPNSGLHVPCQNQLSTTQIAAFTAAGITNYSQPGADGDCAVHPKETLAQQPTFVPFPGDSLGTVTGGIAALVNTNAHALLTAGGAYGGIFPAPTSGNSFVKPVAVPTNVREEIVRIDHNFSDKFTIYGHFVAEQISNNQATTMWSGDNVPTIGNTFGNPSYAGVIHTAYTISPSLVNEAAFNYNGNRIDILPLGLFKHPRSPPTGYFVNAVNVRQPNSVN